MFFTSQYFSNGQPVSNTGLSPLPIFSLYADNRQVAFLCSGLAGNPTEQCSMPGNRKYSIAGQENSFTGLLIQNFFSMKNARKVLGDIASIEAKQLNPGSVVSDSPDCLPNLENPVFQKSAKPREPESPKEETFRSWLKINTPKHKASPALLERIKKITQHNA